MRHQIEKLVAFVDRLSGAAGSLAGWLSLALVAVVCFDVATRYLFDFTLVAVQETQWHLFSLLFLLGAAMTLRDDRHVRVDVLSSRWSPRTRLWIDVLGFVFLLAPFCLLGAKLGWDYAASSFATGESSPQPGGLPARYLLKSAIPLSFGLVFFQGIASALGSLLALQKGRGAKD